MIKERRSHLERALSTSLESLSISGIGLCSSCQSSSRRKDCESLSAWCSRQHWGVTARLLASYKTTMGGLKCALAWSLGLCGGDTENEDGRSGRWKKGEEQQKKLKQNICRFIQLPLLHLYLLLWSTCVSKGSTVPLYTTNGTNPLIQHTHNPHKTECLWCHHLKRSTKMLRRSRKIQEATPCLKVSSCLLSENAWWQQPET